MNYDCVNCNPLIYQPLSELSTFNHSIALYSNPVKLVSGYREWDSGAEELLHTGAVFTALIV